MIDFDLHRQLAIAAVESILPDVTEPGYPLDPGLPINSEPPDVVLAGPGPLRVETNDKGHAKLTIHAKAGYFDLPESRRRSTASSISSEIPTAGRRGVRLARIAGISQNAIA